jgi:hypothetical protein
MLTITVLTNKFIKQYDLHCTQCCMKTASSYVAHKSCDHDQKVKLLELKSTVNSSRLLLYHQWSFTNQMSRTFVEEEPTTNCIVNKAVPLNSTQMR